ncbi:hypothetical protein [Methylotuvimicrobium sp.]|uniref:hypothetical protein n=1 Tax=Methylotuvimicrobium sp. TaxID=2822413 RepID=UPI003D65EFF7
MLNDKISRVVIGGSLVLILALAGCVADRPHRAMAEEMIQTAETREDHEAIAAHYDQEAEEALNKAELMRRHLARYNSRAGGPIARSRDAFIRHCESLIGKYNSIAQENKELAEMHRALAAEIR